MEEEHDQSAQGEVRSEEQPDGGVDASQWIECISDNGETYFTNVVTGESSWTKPGSELEQRDDSSGWTGDSTTEFPTRESSNSAPEASNHKDEDVAAQWEDPEPPADAAPNEAGEIIQWLKLHDPAQNTMYYFAPHTGEVRWELPAEAGADIVQCDSDALLSTIVSLQSASRSQQARARVTSLRQQKMKEHGQEAEYDGNGNSEHENTETSDEIGAHAVESSDNDAGHPNDDSQWVEVYDPVTQEQYYYSPRTSETRWDPPETSASSVQDRQLAAAISIQSLSRGRLARKQVEELRSHSPQHEKQQSLLLIEEDSECEALCRREMNHQELLQLQGGDSFWGLDVHEREVLQKLIEEELAVRTTDLNGQSASLPVNIPFDYQGFEDVYEEEVNTERLQRELQEEQEARTAMSNEEAQQCQNGDSFWGIQAEESNQEAANITMAHEEAASRRFALSVLEQTLSETWEVEVQQHAAKELAERGGQEQRIQARYLRWFYRQCVSVDELLGYRWPSKQQQERIEEAALSPKRRRHFVSQSYSESAKDATPFPLDDLVVRERFENGDLRYGLRSILTVHHQSARGTNGTRFEITSASPECAFDEATAAALLKKQLLLASLEERLDGGLERQEDCGGDGSQEERALSASSVNYRRSRVPDPHLPARFNGIPYKPNQISPTREILSTDHRKLTQLPSLAKTKASFEAPKIRPLQKGKAKARVKVKASSVSPQHVSNNNTVSARGHDSDQDGDTADEDPRTQFRRQEHDVLSKLFALMDVDGSGTVNQNEMRWALQRDVEIHALAKTSPLLRLLLKQRARLEALFSSQTADQLADTNSEDAGQRESSNELSWDEFLARCEHSYLRLMSEGLIQSGVAVRVENRSRGGNSRVLNTAKTYHDEYSASARETEAHTIRRVFALLDIDQNGVVDVAEVQRALYKSAATPKSASRPGTVSKELRALVEGSRALQPMLHEELFMTAFTQFEPLDPRGISEEEFVDFCLEIAHVAAANNMVTSVQ